jgi:succinate-semialdehyde dehydrogenase/glutarate-semialdehyde dehydrogenase
MTTHSLIKESCLIGSSWVTSEQWLEVSNPADGSVVGRVPMLGAEMTRKAIQAAADAFPAWSGKTAHERCEILMAWHDLILANIEGLAAIMTAEQGKPLAEARDEIRYAASYFLWFAEEGKRAYGEIVPTPLAGRRVFVLRQPVGVVAAITPWNFPAAMIARKVAPALAAGCTIVVKPSEQTPLTALAIAALGEQAGLPIGVLNVVTGDAIAIGQELTSNPIVRKLSFTGSTEVGRLLYRQCAQDIKKLSLELGGNAPLIIFDDADLEVAVSGAIAAKFRNAGQTCVCANRIFVQSGIHDRFVRQFAQTAASLKVGPGAEEASQIGPLIDERAAARMASHIDDAIAKGAKVVTGGSSLEGRPRFYQPTVLQGVATNMLCMQEEIFAPLAPVMRFDSEAEVLAMANDTPAGLAAYVFTNDAGRQWRMTEGLEVGMVGVNTGAISAAVIPFGGVKASGLGREGSRHGLDDYMELKTMWLAA